jgi:hypothetical protein
MSKMGSHCSFRHLKCKLWPKEGPGVEFPGVCQFWLPTTKSRESTQNTWLQKTCATYHWKGLDETYNFASDGNTIGGLLRKLWGFKIAGVQSCAISVLPRGTKRPFGCHPRDEPQREIPNGEGGNSPISIHYLSWGNTGGGGNATGWWPCPSPWCSCGATLFLT